MVIVATYVPLACGLGNPGVGVFLMAVNRILNYFCFQIIEVSKYFHLIYFSQRLALEYYTGILEYLHYLKNKNIFYLYMNSWLFLFCLFWIWRNKKIHLNERYIKTFSVLLFIHFPNGENKYFFSYSANNTIAVC